MCNVPTLAFAATRRLARRSAVFSLLLLLAIALVPAPSSAGRADSYPERPIKIVVPFPAGGPTDVAARLIAQSLSSTLGQNVLVENIAGAGGRIGAKAVAGANPDGYTLLLGGTNVNAMLGVIYNNLPFDAIHSFTPVAAICVELDGTRPIAARSCHDSPGAGGVCKEQSWQAEIRCAPRNLHAFRRRVLQSQDGNGHSLRAL